MKKFRDKYRVDSTRMPGWDYAKGGKYYITICTKNRICCFGDVVNGKLKLSKMGEIAHDFWSEIPTHFPNTWLDEFVVMPNHIHGIIVMKRGHLSVDGGDGRNDGDDRHGGHGGHGGHVETLHATALHADPDPDPNANTGNKNKNVRMSAISPQRGALGTIIRSFKSACTKKYNESNFEWHGWQPRFYDEIIRNEKRLHQIRAYIKNNPKNWNDDTFNK